MYDMYPDWSHQEWGPAKHNPENPFSFEAVQQALDLRDAATERPDDN